VPNRTERERRNLVLYFHGRHALPSCFACQCKPCTLADLLAHSSWRAQQDCCCTDKLNMRAKTRAAAIESVIFQELVLLYRSVESVFGLSADHLLSLM